MLAIDGAASSARSIRLGIHSSDLDFLTSTVPMAKRLGIEFSCFCSKSAEAYTPIIGGLSNGEPLDRTIAISWRDPRGLGTVSSSARAGKNEPGNHRTYSSLSLWNRSAHRQCRETYVSSRVRRCFHLLRSPDANCGADVGDILDTVWRGQERARGDVVFDVQGNKYGGGGSDSPTLPRTTPIKNGGVPEFGSIARYQLSVADLVPPAAPRNVGIQ